MIISGTQPVPTDFFPDREAVGGRQAPLWAFPAIPLALIFLGPPPDYPPGSVPNLHFPLT